MERVGVIDREERERAVLLKPDRDRVGRQAQLELHHLHPVLHALLREARRLDHVLNRIGHGAGHDERRRFDGQVRAIDQPLELALTAEHRVLAHDDRLEPLGQACLRADDLDLGDVARFKSARDRFEQALGKLVLSLAHVQLGACLVQPPVGAVDVRELADHLELGLRFGCLGVVAGDADRGRGGPPARAAEDRLREAQGEVVAPGLFGVEGRARVGARGGQRDRRAAARAQGMVTPGSMLTTSAWVPSELRLGRSVRAKDAWVVKVDSKRASSCVTRWAAMVGEMSATRRSRLRSSAEARASSSERSVAGRATNASRRLLGFARRGGEVGSGIGNPFGKLQRVFKVLGQCQRKGAEATPGSPGSQGWPAGVANPGNSRS